MFNIVTKVLQVFVANAVVELWKEDGYNYSIPVRHKKAKGFNEFEFVNLFLWMS